MVDSDHSTGPHDEAETLLPWYATGQLEEADRVRVEAHLARCSHCRDQLFLERRLIREFRAITPEVESGWSRLRARIQAPVSVPRRQANGLGQFWALVSRPAVAGLAAAQLAFLILAGGMLLWLSRPVYHTLGSTPAPASANVIIKFSPETKVRDIDQTLRSADASIVDGPTDANAYLLHVDATKRQTALSRLRSLSEVELAQPIDGVAQ
ncbi:MAG TPA: anti-sigma factor [Sphingomicrobium sp.]|nr:anti-sigma factor [Sphingomicrobium sp.]